MSTQHICADVSPCQGNTDLWMIPLALSKAELAPGMLQPRHIWHCHAQGNPACSPAPQLLSMGLHGDTAPVSS